MQEEAELIKQLIEVLKFHEKKVDKEALEIFRLAHERLKSVLENKNK